MSEPSTLTRPNRRKFLALSGASALALAACSAPSKSSSSAGATKPTHVDKIGFDYPFTQLPLYTTLVKLATAGAKQRGVTLTTTNDASNADTQASSLTAWVGQRMSAIVSFPMVFEATESIAKSALDAGLIWVTYGGSLQHQSADIQFSFVEGGTMLGAAAAKWANDTLGGKGKIAFLTDSTIQLGRDRTSGMINAFTKAAPQIDVVAQEQAIDPDTGLAKATAILAKHPDLNLILGVTDAAAYGGYKALLQAGRASTDGRTFVGGQDGSAPSLLAIKQGTFYRASAALAPNDIAAAVVNVPLAVAAGTANPSVNVPIALVQNSDTAKIDNLLAQNG